MSLISGLRSVDVSALRQAGLSLALAGAIEAAQEHAASISAVPAARQASVAGAAGAEAGPPGAPVQAAPVVVGAAAPGDAQRKGAFRSIALGQLFMLVLVLVLRGHAWGGDVQLAGVVLSYIVSMVTMYFHGSPGDGTAVLQGTVRTMWSIWPSILYWRILVVLVMVLGPLAVVIAMESAGHALRS
ncbi:hypothetical protein HXX76_008551 [Chlamydomonas incerta]|uniref:Uncharacterized protein n=1 Tax=Chlamydomonas incerta TaxID=51695 RepID=A0A835ST12_CHLIN|nr:hypothetical protein HXX76_008551 [Chlamydomonas incerta]|eukprot:KAG2432817.1 hypothetical protein HXX76_008551 [Chlamydomonas incerta]